MIATTIEQSKKLVELGIDISTADMCWCNNSVKGVNYTDNYTLHTHTLQELKEVFDEALNGWDKYWEIVPAWSLDALLKLMPIVDEKTYKLYGTLDGGCVCEHPCTSVMFQEESAIDAVFKMVVWLKKNKFI